MTQPLLELINIQRHYGDVHVLNGAHLSVRAGEAVAIVGPSGSGKSTLLHVAGLLDTPDSGKVLLQGKDVAKLGDDAKALLRNTSCGFVYQFHHLLREFTALENVLIPARIAGGRGDEARARRLLQAVGLEKRLHHLPSQLSGGEQQRVAIARALMNKPTLLLSDEPTGNLDPHTAETVADLLFGLMREEGMAALMVTHNPSLAARCDRVLTMHEGVLTEAAQVKAKVKAVTVKKMPARTRKKSA